MIKKALITGITENMKNDFILTKNNKNTFGVFRCLRW